MAGSQLINDGTGDPGSSNPVPASPVPATTSPAPSPSSFSVPPTTFDPASPRGTNPTAVVASAASNLAAWLAAHPVLRTELPTPIGMGPGDPNEQAVYTYAGAVGLDPNILNRVTLGTSLRDLITGGAYTQTQIDSAFGNTGSMDLSNPFYSTDATAYGWGSVLGTVESFAGIPSSGTATPNGSNVTTPTPVTPPNSVESLQVDGTTGQTTGTATASSTGDPSSIETDLLGAITGMYADAGVGGGDQSTPGLVSDPIAGTAAVATPAASSSSGLVIVLVIAVVGIAWYFYHKSHKGASAAPKAGE